MRVGENWADLADGGIYTGPYHIVSLDEQELVLERYAGYWQGTPALPGISVRFVTVQALLTTLGASVIVWALLPFAPGDPALRILQAQGYEDPNLVQLDQMRQKMGLDQPLPAQYVQWLGCVAQGDLSVSYQTGKPVIEELAKRLPATLLLLGTTLIIAIVVALSAALVAVATQGRWPDRAIRLLTQVGASMPTFLIGLVLLQYLVVGAKVGRVLSGGTFDVVLLPALCLAWPKAANWTQLLRARLIEVLGSNYVLVARARGAQKIHVLLRYALPNAALPFLTALGVSIGALIGGAIPGYGNLRSGVAFGGDSATGVFAQPSVDAQVTAGGRNRSWQLKHGNAIW